MITGFKLMTLWCCKIIQDKDTFQQLWQNLPSGSRLQTQNYVSSIIADISLDVERI